MKYIDMHVHTTASDGRFPPSQVIDMAIEKGLKGIAITDHDTVEGIKEALEYATKKEDFLVIPGIELSTEYKGEEIHILGYLFDYQAQELLEILNIIQNHRVIRAEKITEKLRALGMEITYQEVAEVAGEGIVGRPHIASVLVKKGYVKDTHEAFKRYLAKGCPAFVERFKLDPFEAIDLVKRLGGYAVVAHPSLITDGSILQELIEAGADGIEVYHPENNKEATDCYLALTKKHQLLVTGGSDFHYPPNEEVYHGDIGCKRVSFDSIERLLNRIYELPSEIHQ